LYRHRRVAPLESLVLPILPGYPIGFLWLGCRRTSLWSTGMPHPSDNLNGADDAVEQPILHAWPEFWWMSERDRSEAFEARALP
jgi:hypothetical protein